MDPNAALRMIDDADRVDAETREVMRGLYTWLSRGGFAPDWSRYPKGARRFRKAYGEPTARSHATKRAPSHATIKVGDIVQRSDIDGRNRYVVINIRDPWIYTRRVSGSGTPGIITFPSAYMLKKVS